VRFSPFALDAFVSASTRNSSPSFLTEPFAATWSTRTCVVTLQGNANRGEAWHAKTMETQRCSVATDRTDPTTAATIDGRGRLWQDTRAVLNQFCGFGHRGKEYHVENFLGTVRLGACKSCSGIYTRLLVPQRHHGIDRNRSSRRNPAGNNRNQGQQQSNASERHRIMIRYSEEHAFQNPRRCKRQSQPNR
jgi:hypothetical protein